MAKQDTQTASGIDDRLRGLLYAQLAIPAGIILWVVLWKIGLMSAIVSFVIAAGAIYLYKLGSKKDVTRKEIIPIMIIVLAGVILAFMSGMMSDAWDVFSKETNLSFFSAEFFDFFFSASSNPQVWEAYTTDIIVTALFTLLGTWSVMHDLFRNTSSVKVTK